MPSVFFFIVHDWYPRKSVGPWSTGKLDIRLCNAVSAVPGSLQFRKIECFDATWRNCHENARRPQNCVRRFSLWEHLAGTSGRETLRSGASHQYSAARMYQKSSLTRVARICVYLRQLSQRCEIVTCCVRKLSHSLNTKNATGVYFVLMIGKPANGRTSLVGKIT